MAELVKRILLVWILFSAQVMACGPSPQKVVEKIVIKQSPEAVWALVEDLEKMHIWHPDVISSAVENRFDSTGKETIFRMLVLRDGGRLIERIRETPTSMKLGTVIEQGDIVVSNYSDALTVMPGEHTDETLVTWTGRFNNKANLLVAPEGQDNKAAIAAVEQFYQHGLNGLKAYVELVKK